MIKDCMKRIFNKEKTKKLWIPLLICCIFAVAGWFFYHATFDQIDTIPFSSEKTTWKAVEDREVIESSYVTDAKLKQISISYSLTNAAPSIKVQTNNNSKKDDCAKGYLKAELIDPDNHVISSTLVNYSDLSEKAFSPVLAHFTYAANENRPVKIQITFHQQNDIPLSVAINQDGTLSACMNGFLNTRDNHSLVKGYWILFALLFAAVLLGYLMLAVFHAKLHWCFLTVGVLLIMGFDMVLPIQSAPDEWNHYSQSYRFSDRLMGEQADPSLITMRHDDAFIFDMIDENPTKQTYLTVFGNIGKKIDGDPNELPMPVEKFGWDGPSYVFEGLAITAGRLMNFNYVTVYYMARVANSLLYLLLFTLAIAIVPVRKGFFAVSALLPMALHLGSSCSSDTQMFPMAFLVFAAWLRLLLKPETEPINIKDWLLFCIPLALLAPSKVYVLFCPLVLFVPAKKFKNRHSSRIYRWGSLAIVALFMLLQTGGNAVSYTTPGTKTLFTPRFLLTHLQETFLMLFDTLKELKGTLIESMAGSRLGWSKIPVDHFWIIAFIVLLVLSMLWKKEESERLPRPLTKHRWQMVFIILLVTGATVYAAFTWTMIYYHFVDGLQGRYFLPLLPLLLILFQQNNLAPKKGIDRPLIFCGVFCDAFLLLELFANLLSGTPTIG